MALFNLTLLIHYNHSKYIDSIPFLTELYQPYFKDIVFYASKPEQQNKYKNLYFSDTRGGHSGYKALSDFIATSHKISSTDGVLYMMDDVLLNVDYLKKMDLTKPLYFSQEDEKILIEDKCLDDFSNEEHWGVWGRETGKEACRKVIQHANNTIFKETDFLIKLSDFFYIPNQEITEELVKYLHIFENAYLHLEIAIPSLFKKLFYKKYGTQNFNALPNILGGSANITKYTVDNFKKYIYSTNLYVHRVKMSTLENQQYVKDLLK